MAWKKLILCTGARELLLPFPGWTLPGVTGAGGLQALVKSGLPVKGERIVIAGSGPLLLAAAATATKAGAQVVRIAEQAGLKAVAGFAAQLARWPGKAMQSLDLFSTAYRTGSHVLSAQGESRLVSVRLRRGASCVEDIVCDRVACGFGLVPNTELGQHLGCAVVTRHGSDALAVDAAQADRLRPQLTRWDAFAAALHHSFALAEPLRRLAAPDTLVCRCEDVPQSALAACGGWTEAKLHTRCGMGACQGRVCGAAAQFLFGWTPPAPRPPLSPARIATLASTPNPD
jgi:NADPH-dependent 2,4-dienoyl-CoA reductase/sulfur reductase-like enzyme